VSKLAVSAPAHFCTQLSESTCIFGRLLHMQVKSVGPTLQLYLGAVASMHALGQAANLLARSTHFGGDWAAARPNVRARMVKYFIMNEGL